MGNPALVDAVIRDRPSRRFGFLTKSGAIRRQDGQISDQSPVHRSDAAAPDRPTCQAGRPSFNVLQTFLQTYGSSATPPFYYVFDVLTLAGVDVTSEQLVRRRELQTRVLSKLDEPIRESPILDASLPDLIRSVKAQGLEGIVAKRLDRRSEPALRSGMWQKMRVNQGAGVHDRRIHAQCKELRRPDIRVL